MVNEILKIIYALYQEIEIIKKVYNNIMNSIKFLNRVDTIFVSSKNIKTSELHWLLFNLTGKINIKTCEKNIRKSYQNNKFKISAPTWNEEFELPDRSYSVSDIQNYFDCFFKIIINSIANLYRKELKNQILKN